MLGNWKTEHDALYLCCFKINKKFLHKIKVLPFFDRTSIIPWIYYLFYFYIEHMWFYSEAAKYIVEQASGNKIIFLTENSSTTQTYTKPSVNLSNSPACWISCLHEKKYTEFRTRSFREKRFLLSIIKNLCKNLLKIRKLKYMTNILTTTNVLATLLNIICLIS